jgi:glycerol uptake facilitator-like aquaporin
MRMASSWDNPSLGGFLIAVVLAAGLATLIFRHADRHGSRHATAWGLFTFLAALVAIPLYFSNYWLSKARQSS